MAGSTTSRPSTRSQTPAIRQQSTPQRSTSRFKVNIPKTPPSVPSRKDSPIVSPSQAQETATSAYSAVIPPVIPPIGESLASDDQIAPATENPAKSISEENLGVIEKSKDKAKWKGKEVVRFDELPVLETDTKEDLYGDLYGIPADSRTVPWSSMGGRPGPNIGSSHSKCIESSSRDPGSRPLPRFALTEPSSSASKVTFAERVKVIGKDKMKKENPDPADYSSDEYESGHLDQYRVANYDYPSDDDIDVKYALKSSEMEGRYVPLTKEQLDFCWNAWDSVMKAYKHNLEKGISYEETGERLYRREPLIQE